MTVKSEVQAAAQLLEVTLDYLDAEVERLGEVARDVTLKFCEMRDLINDLEED